MVSTVHVESLFHFFTHSMTLARLTSKLPLAFTNSLAIKTNQGSDVALNSLRLDVKCKVSLTLRVLIHVMVIKLGEQHPTEGTVVRIVSYVIREVKLDE